MNSLAKSLLLTGLGIKGLQYGQQFLVKKSLRKGGYRGYRLEKGRLIGSCKEVRKFSRYRKFLPTTLVGGGGFDQTVEPAEPIEDWSLLSQEVVGTKAIYWQGENHGPIIECGLNLIRPLMKREVLVIDQVKLVMDYLEKDQEVFGLLNGGRIVDISKSQEELIDRWAGYQSRHLSWFSNSLIVAGIGTLLISK